jgi:hypothetical protein
MGLPVSGTYENRTDAPVTLHLLGGDVVVPPWTSFFGTVRVQSFTVLRPISAEAFTKALLDLDKGPGR